MGDQSDSGTVVRDRIPWTGRYISQSHARARQRSIEAELNKAGIAASYTRVEAVDCATLPAGRTALTSAERGALWSHRKAVEIDHPGDPFIHVLEDNVILARAFRPIIEQFIQGAAFAAFDLVFTHLTISTPPVGPIPRLRRANAAATATAPDIDFRLMSLRGLNFRGAGSYFINPASLGKIRALLQRECAAGTTLQAGIELLYRREVDAGRLRAACVFPFVSNIDPGLVSVSAAVARPGGLQEELLRSEFYVDSEVKLSIPAIAREDQPKGTGPVAVLSCDPPVFNTGIAYDEFLGIAPSFGERYGDVAAGFLIYPTWTIEDRDTAVRVAEAAGEHLDRYPNHRVEFLTNTQREADLLSEFGQPAICLNKNFTVSDAIFRPLPEATIEFDAIYNARFVPEKRHELAARIGSVAYLAYIEATALDPEAQKALLAATLAQNPRHALINPVVDGVPVRLSPRETNAALNRAAVGLCLSATEGSNYASMEYMLAGLPVVSTPSIGGRDVFFDPEYCAVCEPDPGAARDAVEAMKARKLPRDYIRARTLAKIEPERRRFLSIADDLIASLGGRRRFEGPWPFGETTGLTKWDTFQNHLLDFDRATFIARMAAEKGLELAKADLDEVQLHPTELRPIVTAIGERPGCSLLVFGCGRDSVFWEQINRGGTTAFLEDNREWLELARSRLTTAETHLIQYGTRRSDWADLINAPEPARTGPAGGGIVTALGRGPG